MARFNLGSLTGLNWYKWGAIALVAIGLAVGGYFKGKHDCELDHAKQETVKAEERTRTIVKEVEVRVPVVQTREVESTKQRVEIARLQKELFNATRKRPENPSCDLSDDEFNLLQELAGKTRAPK